VTRAALFLLLWVQIVEATVYHGITYTHLNSASELEYPPFAIVTKGQADGFSVELLRSAVAQMGGKVDFTVDSWSRIKASLQEGDIDVLPLVGRTPEREVYFDFSIPYLILHGTAIVRNDDTKIKSIGDLKNAVLATMQGDNAHEYIVREGLGSQVVVTRDFESALTALSQGRYDAVIVQQIVATKLIKKLKLTNLRSVDFALEDFRQDFSFAVQEGNKELLAYLNEGLSIVMANGTYGALHDKWFKEEDENSLYSTQILYGVSAFALLLLLIIGVVLTWYASLNKALRRKTKELLESKELYKNFFDNSPSATVIYSSDDFGATFTIEQVNRALERLEHVDARVIEGKKVHEIFKGVEHTSLYEKFQEVYKTGQTLHDPNSLITLEDRAVWREHFIFKLQTGEVVSSYIDHTKEKKLEEDILYNHEKTLLSLVNLIEYRDSYTGGHSQRVATYSQQVAAAMGYSHDECAQIYRAGILHDIGKIVTPDAILLKPSALNESEYELIKTHSEIGATILRDIPMYKDVSEIVLAHHERYDGSGYPKGLKGDEIPMMAQIMAVCDAFDAMTTNRIYRGHKTIEEAVAELESLSGVHFDQNVVDVAAKVLRRVVLDESINQLPSSELESRRFSFFYRDQVTQAYNGEYLNLILKENVKTREYPCINIILVHGFASYNARFGWSQGDKMLNKIADTLQKTYAQTLVFRLHGDDFVVMNKEHLEIDTQKLQEMLQMRDFSISMECVHFHIQNDHLESIHALEERLIRALAE